MRILAQQLLTASAVQVGDLGIGATPTIHAIELVKSSTSAEQIIIYNPFRSEAAATKNRILDVTVGRSGLVREYAPPFVKSADTKLLALGTTNVTIIVWGD